MASLPRMDLENQANRPMFNAMRMRGGSTQLSCKRRRAMMLGLKASNSRGGGMFKEKPLFRSNTGLRDSSSHESPGHQSPGTSSRSVQAGPGFPGEVFQTKGGLHFDRFRHQHCGAAVANTISRG